MDESLEKWVGGFLTKKKWRLTTAESCTGGLIGHRITNVAGSSNYYERGFITYSNEAKREILGVPEKVLIDHGAVSDPCARAMAEGARRAAGAEAGLAVTGIAGPGGGTPEKPVGTVFMAVSLPSGTRSGRFLFEGGRIEVKERTSEAALEMLRDALLEER
ncbi:MAG: CinA family protein [bacterium]